LHTITAQYAGDGNFLGSTNGLSPNQSINTPPVATNDTLATHENIAVSAAAFKLLLNDRDADADSLSVTGVSASSTNGGTVSLSGGTLTYTPAANFSGADSFTYIAADSYSGTSTGTVNVTVYSSANQPERVVSLESLANGNKKITFAGIPGYSYLVQASTNLAVWVSISTNTAAGNGLFNYTDNSATNYPARYYRSSSR
jgi:hypothetical protein